MNGVTRLLELFLPGTDCVAVLFDSFLDAVLDVWRIIRVSGIVWCDWYDICLNQIVMPVKHVEFSITDERYRLLDGERILCDAPRRLLVD
jgi:hypothetical protein